MHTNYVSGIIVDVTIVHTAILYLMINKIISQTLTTLKERYYEMLVLREPLQSSLTQDTFFAWETG